MRRSANIRHETVIRYIVQEVKPLQRMKCSICGELPKIARLVQTTYTYGASPFPETKGKCFCLRHSPNDGKKYLAYVLKKHRIQILDEALTNSDPVIRLIGVTLHAVG